MKTSTLIGPAMHATSLLAAVTLSFSSCGNEPLTAAFDLADSVGGVLTAAVDGTTTKADIWRSDGRRLSLLERESGERLKQQHKHLVMVSFARTSRLEMLLRHDKATLAYFPASDLVGGAALVGVDDAQSLDMLAAAAHEGPGHACGRLQMLDLNAVQNLTELKAPVYEHVAALPAVTALTSAPQASRIAASIKTLEAMGTRFHSTAAGLAAPEQIKQMMTDAAGSLNLSVQEVDHATAANSTAQKSLIATLPGSAEDGSVVIVGAHLDSINSAGKDEPAPGADDDASGIATIIEIIKVLADGGAKFSRRVEFHAYAAEEVGLRGSAHIAQTYREEGRSVAAMLQLDMNAWHADSASKTIYLVSKDTSDALRRSLKNLLNLYLGGDYVEKNLPAGTSDHRSWSDRGFAAVFPFEDPDNYNTLLHTPDDTSAAATNTALSARFAQLVLTFLAHHAGLDGAAAEAVTARAAWRAATPKDLQLAIEPGAFDGLIKVTVASTGISSVELCVITEPGSTGCTGEMVRATLADDVGGRQFFTADEELPLAAGSRLAVFAYDGADKLVLQRSVRLDAK